MTFAKFTQAIAESGRVPLAERPTAAAVIRSAEGGPSHDVGGKLRTPPPVPDEAVQRIRAARLNAQA